jgi:hypothetical protein
MYRPGGIDSLQHMKSQKRVLQQALFVVTSRCGCTDFPNASLATAALPRPIVAESSEATIGEKSPKARLQLKLCYYCSK